MSGEIIGCGIICNDGDVGNGLMCLLILSVILSVFLLLI